MCLVYSEATRKIKKICAQLWTLQCQPPRVSGGVNIMTCPIEDDNRIPCNEVLIFTLHLCFLFPLFGKTKLSAHFKNKMCRKIWTFHWCSSMINIFLLE